MSLRLAALERPSRRHRLLAQERRRVQQESVPCYPPGTHKSKRTPDGTILDPVRRPIAADVLSAQAAAKPSWSRHSAMHNWTPDRLHPSGWPSSMQSPSPEDGDVCVVTGPQSTGGKTTVCVSRPERMSQVPSWSPLTSRRVEAPRVSAPRAKRCPVYATTLNSKGNLEALGNDNTDRAWLRGHVELFDQRRRALPACERGEPGWAPDRPAIPYRSCVGGLTGTCDRARVFATARAEPGLKCCWENCETEARPDSLFGNSWHYVGGFEAKLGGG